MSKMFDVVVKILSILVIPVILWGIKIQVTNALQNERIAELQDKVEKNSNIADSVQENTLALVKLEAKIDNMGDKIDAIKDLLGNQ